MEKNTVIATVLSAVGGAVIGGGITYFTVNKALRTRYEDWANAEINEVKMRYSARGVENPISIINEAVEPSEEVQATIEAGRRLIEAFGYDTAVVDEDGTMRVENVRHESAQTLRIFDREEDEADDEDDEPEDKYEVIEGQPSMITEAAFFENEPDYVLETLTYYELDDTLTDEHNERIDTVEETVGVRHLHEFQKSKTGGKTSIYIRNDLHETLYEVILVEGAYAVVVMGMDETLLGLKEPKKKLKKMRPGDGE